MGRANFDMVHMDIKQMDCIINKHSLSQEQAKEVFEKGFLSKDIFYAFLKPAVPETRPNETWYSKQILPASTNSIKVDPSMVYITNGYNFLISDFYLICYKGRNEMHRDNIWVTTRQGYRYEYWRNSEYIFLIPLEKLEKFEIEFSNYTERYSEFIERIDPEKRAFNGACLGMILGGTAGAVIGAHEFYKGASEKTVTYVSRKNTYKLIIKFTNGDFIVIDDYWQTTGKENDKLAKMEKINREVADLIKNSKLDLTDEEKRQKVNADIAGKNFSLVCGIIFIVIIIILLIAS